MRITRGGGTCLNAPSSQLRHPELDCLLLPKTIFCAKWPIRAGSINSNKKSIDRFRVKHGMTSSAFTLAEVLITLGIIGVVAAITLPALIANYQKKVLNDQFKKSYSLVQQAWRKAEASLGYTPECFYWEKSPYNAICVDKDKYGNCKKYEMPDGGPVPADKNGKTGECSIFMEQIIKELNVIKTCKGNGLRDGCIPEYEGLDTVQGSYDDSLTEEDLAGMSGGCSYFRKTQIHNNRTIYVLKDGTILFPYSGPQLFAVDVNGKKGPNKWGYDVFTFQTFVKNVNSPLQISAGGCMKAEKGGVSTSQKLIGIYK